MAVITDTILKKKTTLVHKCSLVWLVAGLLPGPSASVAAPASHGTSVAVGAVATSTAAPTWASTL